MATLNQVAIKIIVDGKEMEASLGEFNDLTRKAGVSGQRSGASIKQGFTAAKIAIVAAAAAVTGIIMGLNKCVDAASNFTEANNKLLTIFKSMPKVARNARDELVDAYHMSYREAAQLLGATGDLLTGLGMQEEKSLELSLTTQKLAADLTSFSNVEGGVERASQALTSGLLGEREAMKSLGIIINEEMVKQELRAKGLDKLTGLSLQAAKAEVTLALALTQSKNALGDTARTANDYASVQRQVGAQMENLSMQLGSVFIPIWNKVLKGFLDLLEILGEENITGILYASWIVIKEFAVRTYDVISGIIGALVSLASKNYAAATMYMNQVGAAVALGWEQVFKDVEEAYEQGEIDYKSFLDGSLQAHSDNQVAQIEQQAEFDEIKKAKNSEFWDAITARVKRYDGDLNKILEVEEKRRAKLAMAELKMEDDKNKAKLKNQQASYSDIGAIAGSFFGKSKAMAYGQAIIQTYLGVARVIGQTGILSPFAIPAVLATGLAAAARISATSYALGGEINRPTLALAGEAGPEIAAPRKTFIDVVNQMVRGGEIGGGKSSMQGLKEVKEAIEGLELKVSLEASELSVTVEQGDKELTNLDW